MIDFASRNASCCVVTWLAVSSRNVLWCNVTSFPGCLMNDRLIAELDALEKSCRLNMANAQQVMRTGRLYERKNQALGRVQTYKIILRRLWKLRMIIETR